VIVAIDGPSGAGKSSVAKAAAKKLGFACLDTGAMYRAIAWEALRQGVALDNTCELGKLAEASTITFKHVGESPIPAGVEINGHDVTSAIRTAEIDRAVTPVSAAPEVRAAMVGLQRKIGHAGNYVIEGRDIGTVVFPDAEVKVFLTASDEERAHRRVRQNADRGVGSIDFEEVLRDLRRRDAADSSRETAPLQAASDAHMIDSTNTYIEDVIEQICDLARKAQM
jgi:cytidylate kinase